MLTTALTRPRQKYPFGWGAGVTMDGSMLQALLFNVVAAGLIYLYFMLERVRIGRLEAKQGTALETRDLGAPKEVIHV